MSEPTDKELSLAPIVVHIDEYRFKRTNRRYSSDECQHFNILMDDNGQIMTCEDCGKQVSAYWSIQRFLESWSSAWKEIKSARQRIAELERTQVVLKAAKLVETAWRRRKSVPTCPHCRKAILPQDGFGNSWTSKTLELKRREKSGTS